VAAIVEGHVGCIVIRPDKTRQLAYVVPDPSGVAGRNVD
jgi:hypothetical protein